MKCPPANLAPNAFLHQLDAIDPGIWGTPCSVTLVDGTSQDICLAWENVRYSDKGDWLSPIKVAEVRECRFRLPAKFSRVVHEAGESGMGYHVYIVELADGTSFVHTAGNLTIDLLDLPIGYTPGDVVRVLPHRGRVRTAWDGYRQIKGFCSLEYARESIGP